MQLILQIATGPAHGEKFLLRHGQIAKVGRTEWADFGVPLDSSMDEFHFAVQCGPVDCRLIDLEGPSQTLVNGKPVEHVVLRSGDQILAGETSFAVTILGETGSDVANGIEGHSSCCREEDSAPIENVAATDPTNDSRPVSSPANLVEWCQVLELSERSIALAQQSDDPLRLIDQLVSESLFPDAICLVATILPKPVAVAWGVECVRPFTSNDSPTTQAALEAAARWSQDPQEEHRRYAEAAAKATKFEGATCWVALAAFWSDGSLGPPDQPVVEPPRHLTAKGITGALMLAATNGEPAEANKRYRRFLENGIKKLKE